jgi:hypothetical protein
MGATTYSEYASGADAKAGFARLQADADHEYGHDSYNGQINQAWGFKVIQSTPLPPNRARELGEQIMDDVNMGAKRWPRLAWLDDKRGEAGAIAICSKGVTSRERTVKVTLQLTAKQLADHNFDQHEALRKAAIAKVAVREREHIGRVEVKVLTTRVRTETVKAESRAVKRWQVVQKERGGLHPFTQLGLHESAAKARKAAADYISADPWRASQFAASPLGVQAVMAHEDGQMSEQLRVLGATVTAEATVQVEKLPANAKVDGWLFIGTAGT